MLPFVAEQGYKFCNFLRIVFGYNFLSKSLRINNPAAVIKFDVENAVSPGVVNKFR